MHEMCTKRKQDVQQGLLIIFQATHMRQTLSHKLSYESKMHLIATCPALILITLVVLKIT